MTSPSATWRQSSTPSNDSEPIVAAFEAQVQELQQQLEVQHVVFAAGAPADAAVMAQQQHLHPQASQKKPFAEMLALRDQTRAELEEARSNIVVPWRGRAIH